MLAHLPALATSFDCQKGRSLTERMICHDAALSKLDDTLGQLYWKARRRVIDRRAFLSDSDSKWAWREANCRDAVCLNAWYGTRIDELEKLIDSRHQDGEGDGATPPDKNPDTPRGPSARGELRGISRPTRTTLLQCTATHPGIALHDPCSTVIGQRRESGESTESGQGGQWRGEPPGGDWFCALAMLSEAAPSQ
ncbi:MAG TPA: hypothetical protein VFE79_13570 [Paraburkholderia sp.]|nr:hypothetical protein [Paraburkholderia sp.]